MTLVVAGCAGRRIEAGVFHSAKGYRVGVPGGEWTVANESRADLELRHRTEPAGMLVNASCDAGAPRAGPAVLARHLLSGLRDRTVISTEEIVVDGRVTRHSVVEGRLGREDDPVTLEVYVMRDARCVYDFLYAAPPASFPRWEGEFQRFVGTFASE